MITARAMDQDQGWAFFIRVLRFMGEVVEFGGGRYVLLLAPMMDAVGCIFGEGDINADLRALPRR